MTTIKLSKEQQEQAIVHIQQYFESERGETLGHLGADHILQLFMTHIAPHVYNQALSDCRHTVEQRMISLEEDIYSLEQKLPRTR